MSNLASLRRTVRGKWGLLPLGTVALVAALGSTSVAAADKIELTELAYSSDGASLVAYLKEMATQFEALHPNIHITFVDTAGSEATKLAPLLAAGTPPDLTDFYPAMAAPFIGNGTFLDLTPYIKRDNIDMSTLMPAAVNGFAADGAQWGIPVGLYPIPAWYNEDLLSAAGLATPYEMGLDNWTWSTVESMAKKLTLHDASGKLTQLGLDRFAARPEIQIRQAGGFEYDRLTNPTASRWNTQPVIDALTYMQRVIVDDGAAAAKFIPSLYFWTGNSAIDLVDGPGIIGPYMSKATFKWDIAPQPKGPANNGTLAGSGWGLQILAGSKHPEAAWEWLKYVGLRPASLQEFVKMSGRMPAMIPVTQQYRNFVSAAPQHWMAFSDVALNPASYAGYVVPDKAVTDAANKVLAQVWAGKVAPKVAAQEIDQQVSALLKQDASKK